MNSNRIDVRHLTKVEESLFITLYARALDSRSRAPILGDTAADDLVRGINYDYAKLNISKEQYNTAIRTKELDRRVEDFIVKNPEGTVLDLGCGLDSRILRVNPPAGIRWYDIDLPNVIDLRRRLYPARNGYRMIGASLTDGDWLDEIPTDQPAMIVADGVLPFLAGSDVKQLFTRLTRHFQSGEIAFNGYTTLAVRLMKNTPAIKAIGVTAGLGFDDPREPEQWAPRLKLVEESFLIDSPHAAKMPWGFRVLARVMSLNPALKREGGRILRYQF